MTTATMTTATDTADVAKSDVIASDAIDADPDRDCDALMAKSIAGRTIGESIVEAESTAALVAQGGGRWRIPATDLAASEWMREKHDASRNCKFYMGVMFKHVYRESRVPQGCASCFKIKVAPRTLRELVALREIARTLPYTSKCGIEPRALYSSGIYGGYFYRNSLDDARTAYACIRQAVTAHPKLGADVPVFIKRGCTIYEIKCGPSDQYHFEPELGAIESALLQRIELPPQRQKNPIKERALTLALWIETAYMLGDETYRDFTGGKRWYPATVKYDPDEAVTLDYGNHS